MAGTVIENVRTIHELTTKYDFDARPDHPQQCPLLKNDVCSIFESGPMTCRLAGSADAEICARTYHHPTNEDVPTPMMYLFSRNSFAVRWRQGSAKQDYRITRTNSMPHSRANSTPRMPNDDGLPEKTSSTTYVETQKTHSRLLSARQLYQHTFTD